MSDIVRRTCNVHGEWFSIPGLSLGGCPSCQGNLDLAYPGQIASLTAERDTWRRRLHGADNLLAEIDVALGGLPLGVDRVENARRVQAERDAARKGLDQALAAVDGMQEELLCQIRRAGKAEAEIARLRALVERLVRAKANCEQAADYDGPDWATKMGNADAKWHAALESMIEATREWTNSDAKRAVGDA